MQSVLTVKGNYETGSVLSGLLATLLAAYYSFMRVGFDFRIEPVLVLLGLTYFILFASLYSSNGLARVLPKVKQSWVQSVAFGTVLALGIVFGIGALPTFVARPLAVLLAATGCLLAIITLIRWLKDDAWWHILLLILVSLVLLLQVIWRSWGSEYLTPLFREQIILGNIGGGTLDTLFFGSISQMVTTYGVASTGLDGIPFLYYHTGSMVMHANLARMTGLSVLESYQGGYPVFFISAYLFAIIVFIISVRESSTEAGRPLRRDWFFWATFVLILWTGVNPVTFNIRTLSQSYLTALIFTFLLLALVIVAFKQDNLLEQPERPVNMALLAILIPLLVFCAGVAKLSVLTLLFGVALVMYIRLGMFRKPVTLIALFTLFAAAIAAILLVFPKGSGLSEITGFSIWSLTFGEHPFIWFSFFYLWVYIYLGLRFTRTRIRRIADLQRVFQDRSLLDVEFLLLILGGSIAPEFIFEGGFNNFYFTDIPVVIGMAMLLALLLRLREEVDLLRFDRDLFTREAQLGSWVLLTLVVCMSIAMVSTLRQEAGIVIKNQLITKASISNLPADGSGISRRSMVVGWITSGNMEAIGDWLASQNATLSNAPNYAIIQALEGLNQLPTAMKRESLLFIPQTNTTYWHLFRMEHNHVPYAQPFVAPAFSGLAQLDGIPPDLQSKYNGYWSYDLPPEDRNLSPADPGGLCEAVLAKGFGRVIVLDANADGEPIVEHINCDN